MNKEEIKAAYNMRDIAARYDLQPNRSGFIRCPFHQDPGPSLKVYDKDFHCFGCGANGDIFDFVQRMDDLSFREAFQLLGGVYEKPTFASKLAIYRVQKQQKMRLKEQMRRSENQRLNGLLISIYRAYVQRSEPFSDVWMDCYNRLQYQLYMHGELSGIEEG